MKTPNNSAEVQLQQELREMFLIDTQQQLETYFDIIQRLTPESWIGDIQSIYRAIHTIKGGAVTVDADSMLHGAMVLEDLLSDLRYLEIAPPLSDGKLSQILLETGELLASCLEISGSGTGTKLGSGDDDYRLQLTIQRLQNLHAQVKEQYLPEWNEMKQVHQEFAEQGFELVILDLEMELADLPAEGAVPVNIVATAQATIAQLTQIGTDLELASGWLILVQYGDRLISNPDSQLWRSLWLPYFEVLKACVKNSGELSPAEIDRLDELETTAQIVGNNSVSLVAIEDDWDLPDLLDNFFLDEDIEVDSDQKVYSFDHEEIDDFAELSKLDEVELIALIENGLVEVATDLTVPTIEQPAQSANTTSIEVKRGISIPVPLERLDRSAQQVVDTLLTARAVRNVSTRLQSQLSQLNILTQESSQFVTRLRQLQDDYALLRSLNDDSAERRLRQRDSNSNVTTERYRQGYTTIVRLLENILRMSELGQEIETATYQNHHNLEDLDRSIMRLKDGIETSRLVPFRNLTLRAKAILRDLTNRYGKSAELIVQNEQVELDAGIVQQLEPALLHLLRNAYDHGLEPTPLRLAAGKTALGTISVSLQRRGNLYRLEGQLPTIKRSTAMMGACI